MFLYWWGEPDSTFERFDNLYSQVRRPTQICVTKSPKFASEKALNTCIDCCSGSIQQHRDVSFLAIGHVYNAPWRSIYRPGGQSWTSLKNVPEAPKAPKDFEFWP